MDGKRFSTRTEIEIDKNANLISTITINVYINYDNKQLIQRNVKIDYNAAHLSCVFDILANKNRRICMESHYHKIKKKTCLERLI